MSIKEIRKSCGYTQKELANRLNIATCTLAHYESGMRKITLEMFLKIVDVCNLDLKIEEKTSNKNASN